MKKALLMAFLNKVSNMLNELLQEQPENDKLGAIYREVNYLIAQLQND